MKRRAGGGNESKLSGDGQIENDIITIPHPAWPLVDGALLVSKRRSPAPDNLLKTVLC